VTTPYEKNLEILKLRIGFLQHLITLSGTATLIVLIVIQRFVKHPEDVARLAKILFSLFGAATIVSAIGVWWILRHMHENAGGDLESSTGGGTVVLAGICFAAGVVVLAVIGWLFL
jgi:hypothetical protein